jgi:hypothetical protein
MMDAVRTSETSVYCNETTRRSISEGSNVHTRRSENSKSHSIYLFVCGLFNDTFSIAKII